MLKSHKAEKICAEEDIPPLNLGLLELKLKQAAIVFNRIYWGFRKRSNFRGNSNKRIQI